MRVENRIEMYPAPASSASGAPDLMEEIRLSLAQIKSKKVDENSAKKPASKTPIVVKKKLQRARA